MCVCVCVCVDVCARACIYSNVRQDVSKYLLKIIYFEIWNRKHEVNERNTSNNIYIYIYVCVCVCVCVCVRALVFTQTFNRMCQKFNF